MAIEIIDTKELSFSDRSVQKSLVYKSPGVATLVLKIKAGQAIEPCVMTMQVLYTIQSGNGQIFIGNEKAEIIAGNIIVVPAGETRSIQAATDMSVLAFQFMPTNPV